MYSTFNPIGKIIDNAKAKVFNERLGFKPIFEIIEEYIIKHQLITGGDIGLHLLNYSKPIDELIRINHQIVYNIYTTQPFKSSVEITNNIYQWIKKHNIKDKYKHFINSLMTKMIVYNKHYRIEIMSRDIVDIFMEEKFKEIHLTSVLPLVKTPSFLNIVDGFLTKFPFQVLSPETYLISIYQKLYLPTFYTYWSSLLIYEAELIKMIVDKPLNVIDNIMDGGYDKQQINTITLIKKIILDSLFYENNENNESPILIGEIAIDFVNISLSLIKSDIKNQYLLKRIQIISNDMSAEYKEIKNLITKFDSQLLISARQHTTKIFSDERLLRNTIYIAFGNYEIPIVDIYNSAEYDCIPYNTISHINSQSDNKLIKVGNPAVILRFLFIEYWIVNMIQKSTSSNIIDPIFRVPRTQILMKYIIDFHNILPNQNIPLFDDKYYGVYSDPDIANKILIQSKKIHDFKYQPILYEIKYNKLQEFN